MITYFIKEVGIFRKAGCENRKLLLSENDFKVDIMYGYYCGYYLYHSYLELEGMSSKCRIESQQYLIQELTNIITFDINQSTTMITVHRNLWKIWKCSK